MIQEKQVLEIITGQIFVNSANKLGFKRKQAKL